MKDVREEKHEKEQLNSVSSLCETYTRKRPSQGHTGQAGTALVSQPKVAEIKVFSNTSRHLEAQLRKRIEGHFTRWVFSQISVSGDIITCRSHLCWRSCFGRPVQHPGGDPLGTSPHIATPALLLLQPFGLWRSQSHSGQVALGGGVHVAVWSRRDSRVPAGGSLSAGTSSPAQIVTHSVSHHGVCAYMVDHAVSLDMCSAATSVCICLAKDLEVL